jgi:hypothetical protein
MGLPGPSVTSGRIPREQRGEMGRCCAMLADTLLPEAYKVESVPTGPLSVVGFAIFPTLSAI